DAHWQTLTHPFDSIVQFAVKGKPNVPALSGVVRFQVDSGEQLHFTIENTYSPTCALRTDTGLPGNLTKPAIDSKVGPGGFTLGYDGTALKASDTTYSHTKDNATEDSQKICQHIELGTSAGIWGDIVGVEYKNATVTDFCTGTSNGEKWVNGD